MELGEYLLDRGAEPNWIPSWDVDTAGHAQRSGADKLVDWLSARGARSASELD